MKPHFIQRFLSTHDYGGRSTSSAQVQVERIFWMWALAAATLLFFFWWLWQSGWWNRLITGDPSGLSLGIVALTAVLTAWVGRRAWLMRIQVREGSEWRQLYAKWLSDDDDQAGQLLGEISHGPHETAWWLAGATIKLGMLGTVIGFIFMASSIGQAASFDFDQIQGLLKLMTQGMAIALYTTLVGLLANLWLGLLLLILDRTADRLVADIIEQQAAPTPQ